MLQADTPADGRAVKESLPTRHLLAPVLWERGSPSVSTPTALPREQPLLLPLPTSLESMSFTAHGGSHLLQVLGPQSQTPTPVGRGLGGARQAGPSPSLGPWVLYQTALDSVRINGDGCETTQPASSQLCNLFLCLLITQDQEQVGSDPRGCRRGSEAVGGLGSGGQGDRRFIFTGGRGGPGTPKPRRWSLSQAGQD